jgi:hypothetical protein
MFTVTKEWINEHRTARGGFTAHQLMAVGVTWPPPKGWLRALVGEEITDAQRARFERGRQHDERSI